MEKNSRKEIQVGAFVIAALLILSTTVYLIGKLSSSEP